MLDSDGDESAPLVASRQVTGTGCPPNVIAIDVLPDGTFRTLVKYGRVRYVLEVFLEQLVRNPVLYFVKLRIRYQRAIRVRDAGDQKRYLCLHGPPIE
jgi:hypothetical protein